MYQCILLGAELSAILCHIGDERDLARLRLVCRHWHAMVQRRLVFDDPVILIRRRRYLSAVQVLLQPRRARREAPYNIGIDHTLAVAVDHRHRGLVDLILTRYPVIANPMRALRSCLPLDTCQEGCIAALFSRHGHWYTWVEVAVELRCPALVRASPSIADVDRVLQGAAEWAAAGGHEIAIEVIQRALDTTKATPRRRWRMRIVSYRAAVAVLQMPGLPLWLARRVVRVLTPAACAEYHYRMIHLEGTPAVARTYHHCRKMIMSHMDMDVLSTMKARDAIEADLRSHIATDTSIEIDVPVEALRLLPLQEPFDVSYQYEDERHVRVTGVDALKYRQP